MILRAKVARDVPEEPAKIAPPDEPYASSCFINDLNIQ